MKEIGFQAAYNEFMNATQFNSNIGLYETVENNQAFYLGDQWRGVKANGNPTPVFNICDRVVNFQVAKVSAEEFTFHATPINCTGRFTSGDVDKICDVVNRNFGALIERNKIVSLGRESAENAAVDGDTCLYTYWDPDIKTGQEAEGDIVTEIVENTRVLFGNPNSRHVQSQPYIILALRRPVAEVQRMAKRNGQDADAIQPDQEVYQNDMDNLVHNKCTLIIYFAKDPDTDTIWAGKYTQGGTVEPMKDTGLHRYPVTWWSWKKKTDSYHGCALVTNLIPNQVLINQFWALYARHEQTSAFAKPIFDCTRIPYWDAGVGKAIAVNGGDINSVAKILDPAPASPQVAQIIQMSVDMTQTLSGASEVAMGNARPDNAAAIIALQRAADAPLDGQKRSLYQMLEDLAYIYLDFMREYYGVRYAEMKPLSKDEMANQPFGMNLPDMTVNVPFDFSILNEIPLTIGVDVGEASYWSEIMEIQTLDNMAMNGMIDSTEYLERIPAKRIPKKQELIDKRKRAMAAPPMSPAPGGGGDPMIAQEQEVPLQPGRGNWAAQRSILGGV